MVLRRAKREIVPVDKVDSYRHEITTPPKKKRHKKRGITAPLT
jgi:hypothetical protein